ncbi:MAG: type II toxin-antitoxin system HicA family toxin [Methanophagales archaeon ANME-1-THS]|nr:MAG: type II toxin-antitoxin system HicA family toxin [Methanophagales archaeon ANME-1-THS]
MKLPILSAKEIIKVLERAGFKVVRRKGSHISLYKKSGDKMYLVVVPDKKEVKRGTLMSILKQAGMTRERFFELLKQR